MKGKKKLSVSIVVPNWNGRELLARNLPFVIAASDENEIIVSDDASTDGSVQFLKKNYPRIRVTESDHQQGFAGNVNRGVAAARGDIVVLLNTDVRPRPGFLKAMLSDFSDPDVAAVGCLERSHDKGGIVLRGRGVARWEKGYFIHEKGDVTKSDTAWVAGGSCAYRRTVWSELGGMDTVYNPFYWEDIDLSYQALKAGYRLVFEKRSVVDHFHEEGKIKTSYSQRDITRIAYRNQYIFLWKNIADRSLWFSHMVWTPVRLLQSLLHGDTLMIEGYALAIFQCPAIYSSRMKAAVHWRKNDSDVFPHT